MSQSKQKSSRCRATCSAGRLTGNEEVSAVRRVVAEVYLRHGYVASEQIDENGHIDSLTDPHVADSHYFGVYVDGRLASTARLILKDSILSFPAVCGFGIDPSVLLCRSSDPAKYAEVSALARVIRTGNREDIPSLYACMMRYSIEQGQRYWLMLADRRLVARLTTLFSKRIFLTLGAPRFYMGSETMPMLVDIHNALRLYDRALVPFRIRRIFTQTLSGLDATFLEPQFVDILERHGVIGKHSSYARIPMRYKRAPLLRWSRSIPESPSDAPCATQPDH